jgi:pyruvate/2-oxoglutarate dehydrogenase complex dihydrolipoamide acyltransferase (E2) component
MPETLDLITAVYAKTDAGLQEIQSRSLGLPPLVRRILVLVDGKKSGSELAAFLAGNGDIEEVLTHLLAQGCVEAQARKPAAAPAPAPAPAVQAAPSVQEAASADVPGLPPAASRTAKDNEMARNFMINSVNSIIGQNTRISLVNDIFNAQTTEQLRTVYHAWATSMSGHGMGAKRLPELREKLFKVL